jgi:hypothetical protein
MESFELFISFYFFPSLQRYEFMCIIVDNSSKLTIFISLFLTSLTHFLRMPFKTNIWKSGLAYLQVMLCLSFELPEAVAFSSPSKDLIDEDVATLKRPRTGWFENCANMLSTNFSWKFIHSSWVTHLSKRWWIPGV